eukprot:TRINITY_DN101296_c0_g1_i1.p1 TRINITY_DN101296_c0_g1~~TRINITY_DN101296_c0_g1_i1.p1  ORF type:complete len:687 (+),score=124.75 TRINITY_DN101296_c0_g1_i1:66-2126(+)
MGNANPTYSAYGYHGSGLCPAGTLPSSITSVGDSLTKTLNQYSYGHFGHGTDHQFNLPWRSRPLDFTFYDGIAAGNRHTVLLRSDGQAECAGCHRSGQLYVPELPPGLQYVDCAAGGRHTLLLRSDGQIVAFGGNLNGQCQVPPLPESHGSGSGIRYVAIAAGYLHSVAIRSDGKAELFGCNNDGQCKERVPLQHGRKWVAAACGDQHTVLLRDDGEAVAFGYNGDGQCDIPHGGRYTAVAAGPHNTVLLRQDGHAVVIGSNKDGQCNVPDLVVGNLYVAAACGLAHTVLLLSGGHVVAFGFNGHDRCMVPELPMGVLYVGVAASHCHTVLLRSDGHVVAFGDEENGRCQIGQLKNPPSIFRLAPPVGLQPRLSMRTTLKLAKRSICVDDLLHFYHGLFRATYNMDERQVTTKEVVQRIIIPRTRENGCSWVDHIMHSWSPENEPVTYMVESWDMKFTDLLGGILHDATGGALRAPAGFYEESAKGYQSVLNKRYWITAFCINHHHSSISKEDYTPPRNPHTSTPQSPPGGHGHHTHQQHGHPPAGQSAERSHPIYDDSNPQCETNKLAEVAHELRNSRQGRMTLILNKELQTLQDAECVDEIHYALSSGTMLNVAFGTTFPGIPDLSNYRCDVERCNGRQADKARVLNKIKNKDKIPIENFNLRVTEYVQNLAHMHHDGITLLPW